MKMTISKEWVAKMASLEADLPIGIGMPGVDAKTLLTDTPVTEQATQQAVADELAVTGDREYERTSLSR